MFTACIKFIPVALGTILLTNVLPAVAARNYYIATNGNDSNSGTITNPLRSIQEGLNRAMAGDNIYLRSGVYKPTQTLSVGNRGTANERVTLQSYPGERAVIDGSLVTGSNPDFPHIIVIYGSYVDVKNLNFTNSMFSGLVTWEADNVRIINNIINRTQNTGVAIYNSSNIQVIKNKVFLSNLSNKNRDKTGGWGQGISSGRSQNILIDKNIASQNYGEGIGCFLTDKCSVINNVVYDNYSGEIYLDNATNSRVGRNFIYNTGNPEFFRQLSPSSPWLPSSGIQIANEVYETSNPSDSNLIDNNIVLNGSYGFFYGSYDRGGGLKNTKIINNTFYGASEILLFISEDAGHLNSIFANNIFYQTGGKQMTFTPNTSGLKFTDNLWYGSTPSANTISPTDIFSDPLFEATGGNFAANYKLKVGSPAINKGSNTLFSAIDYFGTSRPVNGISDIGAHEYK